MGKNFGYLWCFFKEVEIAKEQVLKAGVDILKESDNIRSFLASKCHILCQKQKASLGDPFPALKIICVSMCDGNALDYFFPWFYE